LSGRDPRGPRPARPVPNHRLGTVPQGSGQVDILRLTPVRPPRSARSAPPHANPVGALPPAHASTPPVAAPRPRPRRRARNTDATERGGSYKPGADALRARFGSRGRCRGVRPGDGPQRRDPRRRHLMPVPGVAPYPIVATTVAPDGGRRRAAAGSWQLGLVMRCCRLGHLADPFGLRRRTASGHRPRRRLVQDSANGAKASRSEPIGTKQTRRTSAPARGRGPHRAARPLDMGPQCQWAAAA